MSHPILACLFWTCILIVLYTYAGYAGLITLLARRTVRRPVWTGATPPVSLVIPAYNEEQYLGAKLDNSLSLDYPSDRLEVIVVADGSSDHTCEIARKYEQRGVKLIYQPQRQGKAAALNRAAAAANGEILIFTDADALLSTGAVRHLVRHFADRQVAAVAGEKRVLGRSDSAASIGEGFYWRYESWLKRCDSAVSSVMGAAGELFAVQRERFVPFEEDAIIEDFVLSFRFIEAGLRVAYEPDAIAYEHGAPTLAAEWVRRTRIAAGGIQAIARLRGMFHPRLGLIVWQYFSHRVLRWAIAPFALILAPGVNLTLLDQPVYRVTLVLQISFYLLALVGFALQERLRWFKLPLWALYFCFVNLAAIAGLVRALRGSQPVTWARVR